MDWISSWSKAVWQSTKNTFRRTVNPQKPIPELHALIIGINQYEKIPQLSGAVADADSIKDYLTSDLSVPSSHITNLRDQEATRTAIINAFRALRKNPNIKPLDPILIYYAGHGCELEAPSGLKCASADPKVQCIIPQDIKLVDRNGDTVCPIPDYTLAALLYDLAEAKGNNITVIFDCCHSASSTRGAFSSYTIPLGGATTFPTLGNTNHRRISMPPPPQLLKPVVYGNDRVRYTAPFILPSIHSFLDRDILRRRSSNTKAPSLSTQQSIPQEASSPNQPAGEGIRSHVLLAACGHAEQAFERYDSKSGYFTSTLLQLLRGKKLDKLTYKACMTGNFPRLETPRPQNPVCEGEHVHRFFFNASVPGAHSSFIPITTVKKDNVLQAGLAQGIFPGDTFSIHAEDVIGPHNPSLGTFVVEPYGHKSSKSLCRLDQRLFRSVKVPSVAYGRLANPKVRSELAIFFTPSFVKAFSTNPSQSVKLGKGQFQVDTMNKANVILDVDATGKVTFEIVDELANLYGLDVLPYNLFTNAPSIEHVLSSMTQWNWHVSRTPKRRCFKEQLRLEFYRLQWIVTDPDSGGETLEPVGENLNKDGVAKITASPDDLYGFKVVNNSSHQLYAYLFWFSTINQAIRSLSLKVCGSAEIDVPLPSNAELTLGYGNDDLAPLSFSLIDKTQVDIGVFRLFVTTSPADFDCMTQPSPFLMLQSTKPVGEEFVNGISDVKGAAQKVNMGNAPPPSSGEQYPQPDTTTLSGRSLGDTPKDLPAQKTSPQSGSNEESPTWQPGTGANDRKSPQPQAPDASLNHTSAAGAEQPELTGVSGIPISNKPSHPGFLNPTTHSATTAMSSLPGVPHPAPDTPTIAYSVFPTKSIPATGPPVPSLPVPAFDTSGSPGSGLPTSLIPFAAANSKHQLPTFSALVFPAAALPVAALPPNVFPTPTFPSSSMSMANLPVPVVPALVFPVPAHPANTQLASVNSTTTVSMPIHPVPAFPALVVQVPNLPMQAIPAPLSMATAMPMAGHPGIKIPSRKRLMPSHVSPAGAVPGSPASKDPAPGIQKPKPPIHETSLSRSAVQPPQTSNELALARGDYVSSTVQSSVQDIWDVVDLKIVILASK